MALIKKFHFSKSVPSNLKEYISSDGKKYGSNWPVVYILSDSKNNPLAYVGETQNASKRMKDHLNDTENTQKQSLIFMHLITDNDFNQSVCLDLENHLIQWLAGSGWKLLNKNEGRGGLDYPLAENYRLKFRIIWGDLKNNKIVTQDLEEIENSLLFKLSPYKNLTETQSNIVSQILSNLNNNLIKSKTIVINGQPGTGKTVVGTYLLKKLKEDYPKKQIGLVVPMPKLRASLKEVIKSINGLKANMIMSPNDVTKKRYDILIVDEAHRLKRRKMLGRYGAYDKINQQLNLNSKATQLDWIIKQSNHKILLYDEGQSIKPSDIRAESINDLNVDHYYLNNQIRIKGGQSYINYITAILANQNPNPISFTNYDFKMFNNLKNMLNSIKKHDRNIGLSRVLAGYAWPWVTKNNPLKDYDFIIEGIPLRWNSDHVKDWINSPNAINEIGCIHVVQGYDLNYAGVIVGGDLRYDESLGKIVINKSSYYDKAGKYSANDYELQKYIKDNIYKILLTRGMHGTYIYVVDKPLRKYLSKFLKIV